MTTSLVQALAKAGFEVIDETLTAKGGRITGRVREANMESWRKSMRRLLLLLDSSPWTLDISRMYFIPKGEHMERYCWRLLVSLKAETPVATWVPELSYVLHDTALDAPPPPKKRVELQEYPLFLNPERNAKAGPGSKGAVPTAGGGG